MVVHTRSEKVRNAVQKILEMHLINHPVDCPICDQAGECGLQDQYMGYGLYESEVSVTDKVNKVKAEVIGPYVILDKERCVLCARCTRFLDEITGTRELGIFNRGVFPDFCYWPKSAEVLIMTILGGIHHFWGPSVGAAILILWIAMRS